jgi:hypothetical protein
MSEDRQLVLVVGIGRSGTSLLAGILGQVGFHIPQPEINADETNPRGFGEPRWVVDFHRRIMRRLRITVFDSRPAAWDAAGTVVDDEAVSGELRDWLSGELGQGRPVVVKDPRVSWFLSLWTRCSADVGVTPAFVTMLRHPAEILTSARKHYGDWQTDASRAVSWLNVMLETERATRGSRRAYVRYEDLLTDWAPQLQRIGRAIEVPLLAELDRTAFPAVDEFVDPTLHRQRTRWDGLEVPAAVSELCERVWDQFQPLASEGADAPPAFAALDASHAEYRALYAEAEAIAQSSVTAVKPRKRAKRAPAPPPPGLAGVRVRIARRIPARHRKRLKQLLGRA